MKAKNQLQAMATNVVTAMNNYRLAAYENLKELGTTISVRSDEDYDPNTGEELDDEDQPNKGVYVYAPGKYYSLTECKVDAVKAGEKQIECHISEENEDGQDCWCTLDYFYEEGQMYILDNIIWPDSVPDEGEAEEEEVYLFFEEQLYDYELLGRHIAVYKSKEEVQKVFDKAVAEERAYAEENGWEIGTDKWDCFEAYPEGSWGTSHSTVEWHKVKVNETASCYL